MNDNENKTNAPIKLPELLPCPFCGSDNVKLCQWRDTENPNATWVECQNCAVTQDTFHHEDAEHVKGIAAMMWNTRVNEADALRAEVEGYRAMIADEHFCEVNVWSYHPLCHDQLVSISESNNQWRWYHGETGGLIANSPVFDTLLEAYAAIKPKDVETSGEGT